VVLLSLFLFASTAVAASNPVIVGDQIAVASSATTGVLLQRFDLLTGEQASAGVRIAETPAVSIRIASDGSNILVVWTTANGTRAALVNANNQVTQLEAFSVSGSAPSHYPYTQRPVVDVTWDGSQFLVAWASLAGPPYHLAAADSQGRITRQLQFSDGSYGLNGIELVTGPGKNLLVVSSLHHDDYLYESDMDVMSFTNELQSLERVAQLESTGGQGTGCSGTRYLDVDGGVFDGVRFQVTWTFTDCRLGSSVRYVELDANANVLDRGLISEMPAVPYYGSLSSARPFLTPDGVVMLGAPALQILRRVSDEPIFFRSLLFPVIPNGQVSILPDGRVLSIEQEPLSDAVSLRFIPMPTVNGRRVTRR